MSAASAGKEKWRPSPPLTADGSLDEARIPACRDCGSRLRPSDALAADWPGTRLAYRDGLCKRCFRDRVLPRPPRTPDGDIDVSAIPTCHLCGTMLRPSGARLKDWPGCRPVAEDGSRMCRPCAEARKSARLDAIAAERRRLEAARMEADAQRTREMLESQRLSRVRALKRRNDDSTEMLIYQDDHGTLWAKLTVKLGYHNPNDARHHQDAVKRACAAYQFGCHRLHLQPLSDPQVRVYPAKTVAVATGRVRNIPRGSR